MLMNKFSTEILQTIFFTGGGYPKIQEDAHQKFLKGDRSALMTALIARSLWQEIKP